MALCVGAEGIRPYQPSCLVHADMKSRNHGVIVNIIGAAGERFNYDYITGSAGNAALMAFTKSLGGKGCAMTFASLELIPSRLKPTASFT
jgi:hypothetical protein